MTSARLVVSQIHSQSVGMRVSVLICHQMARVSQCAWEFIAKVIWCVDRGRSNNNNINFLYCMCFSSLVETSIKQSEHKSFVFFLFFFAFSFCRLLCEIVVYCVWTKGRKLQECKRAWIKEEKNTERSRIEGKSKAIFDLSNNHSNNVDGESESEKESEYAYETGQQSVGPIKCGWHLLSHNQNHSFTRPKLLFSASHSRQWPNIRQSMFSYPFLLSNGLFCFVCVCVDGFLFYDFFNAV